MLAAGAAQALAATPYCDHPIPRSARSWTRRAISAGGADEAGGGERAVRVRARRGALRVRPVGRAGVDDARAARRDVYEQGEPARRAAARRRHAGRLWRHARERARVLRRARPALPHAARLGRVGARVRRRAARRTLGEVRRLDRSRAVASAPRTSASRRGSSNGTGARTRSTSSTSATCMPTSACSRTSTSCCGVPRGRARPSLLANGNDYLAFVRGAPPRSPPRRELIAAYRSSRSTPAHSGRAQRRALPLRRAQSS